MSASACTCGAIRLFDRAVVCWRSLGVNRATPRGDKTAAVLTLRTCQPRFVPVILCCTPPRRKDRRRIRRGASSCDVTQVARPPLDASILRWHCNGSGDPQSHSSFGSLAHERLINAIVALTRRLKLESRGLKTRNARRNGATIHSSMSTVKSQVRRIEFF